ncbi:hypothetical protein Niako_4976 [Niastella koreensis GR20-10]|uniref:Uncharacterized protein n=1 Tax=Niastella koreensis (strain DSM 17620 / KACC 11465 / NBRC 106392 / GR20-10) TaxID=700598 RepID=G8T8N6_NIAKG|nr:hypothetical protein Niako_4976 [Niastella koreensis GR20-10]
MKNLPNLQRNIDHRNLKYHQAKKNEPKYIHFLNQISLLNMQLINSQLKQTDITCL